MFGKLNRQTLVSHFNKAKNLLGNAYHQTKGFLNDVDHGVKVFRSIYGEVQPYLEKYAGQKTGKYLENNINKAISGYDDIRSKVRDVENDIDLVSGNIGNKLRYQ